MQPVLLPVYPEAASVLGIRRTKTFELIKSGELRTVTIGRRRLVPVAAIEEYVARLEQQGSERHLGVA
jgi:excisionase family DNA binding protein